jgi:glycosyltransferase involved in cell wall biosynthesis
MIKTLSVIIPAYNEEATIGNILTKIMEVDLTGGVQKELVVVNDCSKDETEAIVLKYKKDYPISSLPNDYRCPGCNLTEEEIKSRGGWEHQIAKKVRTVWRADHCHKTGKFREYICDYCNNSLGRALDSIETLQRLIKYLEKHNS